MSNVKYGLVTKCGGEGGKPGPCGEAGKDTPADKQPGNHHDNAKRAVGEALDRATHLSPEQREQYKAAAHTVISKMSPKAAERFHKNVSSYRFHESTKALTEHLAKGNEKVKNLLAQGKVVGGSYSPGLGVLNLDGENVLEGKRMATTGVYAHEMSHALDGRTGDRISDSNDWHEAWAAELKDGKISKYAGSTPQEGFAEFGRLVHATKLTPDAIAKHFPLSAKIWKEKGIL